MNWGAWRLSTPFEIVSQSTADRNIPEADYCGEPVGIRSYRLKPTENQMITRPRAARCGALWLFVALLLLVGINIVVFETVSKNVRRYTHPASSAELREVLDSEHVAIGQPAKEKYKTSPFGNILTQGLVGWNNFLPECFVSSHCNSYRHRDIGENDTWSAESLMGVTNAEIANGGVIIFAKNRSNHVSLNDLRRSLAAIDYLRDCLKLGSVR